MFVIHPQITSAVFKSREGQIVFPDRPTEYPCSYSKRRDATSITFTNQNGWRFTVKIGKDAYVGSGTTIREDVPPGALDVSAGKQRNIDGWVATRREGTAGARAAAEARNAGGADTSPTPTGDASATEPE